MVAANQSSFSGGEMAPSFWGRTDLERYRVGARSIENMVVTQLGSLKRRPGLKFVRELEEKSCVFIRKTPGDTSVDNLPYYYNSKGVFAKWDETIETVFNGVPTVLEQVRHWPWPDGEDRSIRNVQVFQNGDIVTFVAPGARPCELRFSGSLSDYKFISRPKIARISIPHDFAAQQWGLVGDGVATVNGLPASLCFRSVPFLVVWRADKKKTVELSSSHTDGPLSDDNNVFSLKGKCFHEAGLCPEDELHPRLPWTYRVSWVYRDPVRGDFEPCCENDLDLYVPIYVDHWTFYVSAPPFYNDEYGAPVAMRVYRGRDGVFGFVGECSVINSGEFSPGDSYYSALINVDANNRLFEQTVPADATMMVMTDDGSTPDMSEQPPTPLENNIELFAEEDSYPNTMCFFEQRAVFGGTSSKPRHLYFSRTGKPYEFTKNADFAPLNSDAMSFQLASTEHEEIQSLVQFHGRLIVLTDKNLWAMGGADGALTPSNATAVCYGGIGASRLQPLVLRNTCLFVSASGNQIFEIRADQNGTQWATRELGTFARHLLDGHSIVSWSYQAVPDPIVWMVREDGVLLSMTYSFETNICAWAHHKTNAFVHSVACCEEKVYVTCERNGVNQLEVMDFFADTRFLDGEREVASPEEAASFGLLGWKDVQPVSSLPGQASEVPLPSLALSGACIAGDAVEAQVQLLDAISYQDLGLRPKTLKKISVDCITPSALKLSEAVGAHSGNETLSESCSRKIVASNVTHSYGFEALGVIESEQPVPLVILGVSREVDFGDIPMQGGSGEDRPR